MKVKGFEVTEVHLFEFGQAIWRSGDTGITAAELIAFMTAHGVPAAGYVAGRVVDRLLQQNRRAGLIAFEKGRWYYGFAALRKLA